MAAIKLHGRTEEVVWEPPLLQFTIERHGGTVLGSSRADRHRWTLDLTAMTATYEQSGYRQLRPMSPRMNVREIAEELAQLMRCHRDDERLKWSEDGSVRVLIDLVIPARGVPRQTVTGRRKRFRRELSELVQQAGGEILRPNV